MRFLRRDSADAGGRTPHELRAEIDRHRAEPPGEGTWIVAERSGREGAFAVITANAALKRIDHPFHDHHVTIAVVMGMDLMPSDGEAATLNAEEDDLLRCLGDVALFAGRTTDPGTRTLHFVARDPELMRPAIDSWAADIPDTLTEGLPQRRLKVNFDRDMAWSFQRELGVR